jgi:IMP dehydrogenase/GMP reductase
VGSFVGLSVDVGSILVIVGLLVGWVVLVGSMSVGAGVQVGVIVFVEFPTEIVCINGSKVSGTVALGEQPVEMVRQKNIRIVEKTDFAL